MVSETRNFLQLDITYVKHILSSSDLDISSEVEVLNAAENWLNFEYVKRSKFAKDLLLRVRLPLLSDHAMENVLRKSYNTRQSSVFQKNEECNVLAKKILNDKENFYAEESTDNYITRYCSQNNYNILICPGRDTKYRHNIVQVDGENPEIVQNLTELPKGDAFWVFNVKSEIYSLIYTFGNNKVFVHKYSTVTNKWENLNLSCEHDSFSECVFMDNIFIIRGVCYFGFF